MHVRINKYRFIGKDGQILSEQENELGEYHFTGDEFYVRTLTDNSPILTISETKKNEGEERIPFMWGHHPAFGAPFLDENCVIDIPAQKILTKKPVGSTSRLMAGRSFDWPFSETRTGESLDLSKVQPKSAGSHEVSYISELREGWYGITNIKMGVGFGMIWDKQLFPNLWFWQVYGGAAGYPYYGKAYTVAIEPWTTCAPNINKAVEDDTAVFLEPEEGISTVLKALAYEANGRIERIEDSGHIIFR